MRNRTNHELIQLIRNGDTAAVVLPVIAAQLGVIQGNVGTDITNTVKAMSDSIGTTRRESARPLKDSAVEY